ncbi:MAG: TRAP transporter small permease subunit [Gammaproteobacteria bacterium WSBS_2016_MAG_OTU1]
MNEKDIAATTEPDLVDELIAERREGGLGELPNDMPPLMASIITRIDKFSNAVGKVVAWLVVPIFVAMVTEILMRKFYEPTLWAYDVSRMLYGALFMLGSGYALMRGVHIRADFLYRLWSPRAQGTVDFFLYLILYFPGMMLFFWTSAEFTLETWARSERLADTAWMPYVAPVRTALPVGVALLLIQGVSEILKSYYAMTRGRWL